ncbi:MAG TPA: hypothetical protein VHT73_02515 [Thermodesulfobacteriota bacterium]|nr:hypothetical protein [Thermodesulfobacteriota bacterium]
MNKKPSGSIDHLEEAKRLVEEYDKSQHSPTEPIHSISVVFSSIAHTFIDIAESFRVIAAKREGDKE